MKIIFRGTPRVWQGTCARCGTVAEADDTDLCHEKSIEGKSFAPCPVCGHEMNFTLGRGDPRDGFYDPTDR